MKNNIFVCIDLKSFYASVECVERHLPALTTNLVVADESRTDKTICLAVSPSLKSYGISGRARLYEVKSAVNKINRDRLVKAKGQFKGSSYDNTKLQKDSKLKLDFIIATPHMKKYMKYSTDIYKIYLKYFSKDDICVYSIDEVFIDVTSYLPMYKLSPKALATKVIKDINTTTGITATCGIGTNMYLAKVAMDIVAKHVEANSDGVRIAELDEMKYRKILWSHRPLTDFWRVGRGLQNRLEKNNMYTMGDIARMSIKDEMLLYKLFGVNAELLIDHAWGYEPCTMKEVKSYKPTTTSLSSGQVLHCPYNYEKTKLIVKEMAELLSLDLVKKHLVTEELVLNIGYDVDNINDSYTGATTKDYYGRTVPKPTHGSIKLDHKTSSTKLIIDAIMKLYERVANKKLLIRRINIAAIDLVNENIGDKETNFKQLDLFSNIDEVKKKTDVVKTQEKNERKVQQAIIKIKDKYGKNSIIKGMNLVDGGTTIERNMEVGGHRE